ncbi:hypothetical protein Bbelb_158250 [Branchiostoma belcheri]|nr:hypothetical protein Bbelb_158250 [Branchiostoma belcheri]
MAAAYYYLSSAFANHKGSYKLRYNHAKLDHPQDPVRDPVAARPECKSRSAPYRILYGSTRKTDRAPDGSLTETGQAASAPRQGAVKEHLIVTLTAGGTLGFMTPACVYTENMPFEM